MTSQSHRPADSSGQELRDRKAIEDALLRFAQAIDSRDWSTYQSQFSTPVEIDYRSLLGGEVLSLSAMAWADQASRSFAGFEATQHFISNLLSSVDGDFGACAAYVYAEHFARSGDDRVSWSMGGRYGARLSRSESGWSIDALRLDVLWSRGDEKIFELAARNAQTSPPQQSERE
ncbi:MAG: nuclear transport factor 2 family protein [Deltaproteobacteria bacterium]|nr:nuclear transport factor 2 family protein [Deltaproteobacteria bacterium]